MMNRNIYIIYIFLFFFSQTSYAEKRALQGKIDSLKTVIDTTEKLISKVGVLNKLAWTIRYLDADSAELICKNALKLLNENYSFLGDSTQISVTSQEAKYPCLSAKLFNTLGGIYIAKSDYPQALFCHFQALKICEELIDKNEIEGKIPVADAYVFIGFIYVLQGDFMKASKFYLKALKIHKELSNSSNKAVAIRGKKGKSTCYNNLGQVYLNVSNYPRALEYLFKAVELNKAMGKKGSLAMNYVNIAWIYAQQDSIRDLHYKMVEVTKPMTYYLKAIALQEEVEDKYGSLVCLKSIAELYFEKDRAGEALPFLHAAEDLALEIGNIEKLADVNYKFSKTYDKLGQYEQSLKYYKSFRVLTDSIFNEEKSKGIGKLEAKHEFEMAELKRQQNEAEQSRILAQQTQRRNQLQYSGIVLVIVGLFIGIFLFARRFKKIKEYKTFRQYTKIVEAALFISFLIFFEFILVVLDPYIEQITGGAPLWKLGFNALLAGIIFPIHSLLEAKLKGQVIKTERKKWVAEAVKGKNLLLVIGLGLVLILNSGFDRSKIDSLKTVLSQSTSDTTRIKTLLKIGDQYEHTLLDTALQHYKEALSISVGINNRKLIAKCSNYIGIIYKNKSDYPQALYYYNQSLEINQQLKDKEAIARNYGNIGNIYKDQSSYSQALSYYFKFLKIYEELGKVQGMAVSYNNIGLIYMNQSSYPQALSYFFKSLKIREELGNKQGMAISYNNIGIIYNHQSSYPQALTYYFKSLKIAKELGHKRGMAFLYNNIGNIYNKQSFYPQALTYYFKSLKIDKEQGNKRGMARSYNNIGSLYTSLYVRGDSLDSVGDWAARNPEKLLDTAMHYQQKAFAIDKELGREYSRTYSLSGIASILMIKGEYSHALEYYHQSAQLADSIDVLQEESDAHSGLANCYEKLNNHKLALEHYKQYSTLKDSIFNEEKSKDLGRLEAKHEFEMAELQKKQLEEEWTKVEATRINRRNDLQHSAILIGIFILFGSLFLLGKLSIPNWLVELSVFIPFLILFEFLLVLLDPSIESWTGSEPAFKLLFNAGLASMMFPLHQFFEGKLKKRIVKAQRLKLKKRMEQYKRDVEEL